MKPSAHWFGKNTCKGMSCSTFDLENRENFFSYLLKPSFSPATSRIQWSLQQYPLQTLPRQRFWQLYRASSYQFLSPCDCCCSFSMTIFDISATERVADGQTVLYFAHVPVEGQKSYVLLGLTYLEPFFKVKFFLSSFGAPLIWKNRWH